MLSLIRSLARSPFAAPIIIGLLVASFALFGVSDVFRVGATTAIVVGEEQISAQELSSAYSRELSSIQQQDSSFTRERAEELGFGEQIIQRLVAQAALDSKATELGLGVDAEDVREAIREIEAFNNPFTGEFDRSAYTQALSNAGFTIPQFEEAIREDLRRVQLISPLISGLPTPDLLAEARHAYANERRAIDALFLTPALAGDIEDPSDETLETFVQENAQIFQRPETRKLTVVRIAPDLIERDIEVSEEDLRAQYDFLLENGELADPATRSLRHWPMADEDTARAAAEAINSGEALANVSASFSLAEPVDLDEVQAFEVPDANIADAAFAMSEGEAQAVEGRLGWRLVYIDAAADPEVPSFEAERERLRSELAADQAVGVVFDRFNVFVEARERGLSLSAAAAEANIPVERFDFVNANGVAESGNRVFGLVQNPEILRTGFELPEGFETDQETYGENGYYPLRVDAVDPSRLPDLSEVRERAEAVWRLRQVDEALQTYVDQALARAEAGESLNAIAEEIGDGARVESTTLTRTGTAGPFTEPLVNRAFAAEAGMPFEARAGDQRTRAIAIVTDIIAPAPRDPLNDPRTELAQAFENDLAETVQRAVLASSEVRRNRDIVDQALGRTAPQR